MTSENKRKVLIIGSNSCVAKAVSGRLYDDGHTLYGTYNKHKPQNLENYEELAELDFNNDNTINNIQDLLKHVDDIFFTFGINDRLIKKNNKINYESIKTLISEIKKNKLNPRVIFCSSSSVYGKNKEKNITPDSKVSPDGYYGRSKVIAEKYLIKNYSNYLILRFPIVFGRFFSSKFDRLKKASLERGLMVFGDGSNNIPFLYEKDLAEVLSKIIEHPLINKTTLLLSSGSFRQKDFIDLVKQYTESDKDIVNIDVKDAMSYAKKQLKLYKKNKTSPNIFKEDIISFSRDRFFDSSSASKMLGLKVDTPSKKAIYETFKSNNSLNREDGIRILSRLFGDRLMSVRIYKNPTDFKIEDFNINKQDKFVWSVTIRDDFDEVVNTIHLFTKDVSTLKNFMKENSNGLKTYSVRISPLKENIKYYGSFMVDRKNFGDTVIISLSQSSLTEFEKKGNGENFKILPRDLDPDITMEYSNGEILDLPNSISYLKEKLIFDIKKIEDYLLGTERADLSSPALFIIDTNNVIKYISLGF